MSRKITKQVKGPSNDIFCYVKKYEIQLNENFYQSLPDANWTSVIGYDQLEINSSNYYELLSSKPEILDQSYLYKNFFGAVDENNTILLNTLNSEKNSKRYRHILIKGFKDLGINNVDCNEDQSSYYIYRAKKYINLLRYEYYFYLLDFEYSIEKNYFSKEHLENGDIIDFSIKILDSSNNQYYLKLWNELKIKKENEEFFIPQESNYILVKNNFFEWSVESFADNLGYRLSNNKKVGKPYALQIYKKNGNTYEKYENAIVTYTLLTFDD